MEMSIEGIDRHSIADAYNTHDPKSLGPGMRIFIFGAIIDFESPVSIKANVLKTDIHCNLCMVGEFDLI